MQASRARMGHLSGAISDDGVDSPTYDGDVETTTSTRTAPGGGAHHGHHHPYDASRLSSASGSVSTLTSPTSATFPSATQTAAQMAAEVHGVTTAPTVTLTAASGTMHSPSASSGPSVAAVQQQQPVNVAAVPLRVSEEPAPAPVSAAQFGPANLGVEDIRAFVDSAIKGGKTEKGVKRTYEINEPPMGRPVRIYADGECYF